MEFYYSVKLGNCRSLPFDVRTRSAAVFRCLDASMHWLLGCKRRLSLWWAFVISKACGLLGRKGSALAFSRAFRELRRWLRTYALISNHRLSLSMLDLQAPSCSAALDRTSTRDWISRAFERPIDHVWVTTYIGVLTRRILLDIGLVLVSLEAPVPA